MSAALPHGAVYDAASWEDRATRIAGNGEAPPAVGETSARSVAEVAGYSKEKRILKLLAFGPRYRGSLGGGAAEGSK